MQLCYFIYRRFCNESSISDSENFWLNINCLFHYKYILSLGILWTLKRVACSDSHKLFLHFMFFYRILFQTPLLCWDLTQHIHYQLLMASYFMHAVKDMHMHSKWVRLVLQQAGNALICGNYRDVPKALYLIWKPTNNDLKMKT